MPDIVECSKCGRTFVSEAARAIAGTIYCPPCAQLLQTQAAQAKPRNLRKALLLAGVLVAAAAVGVLVAVREKPASSSKTKLPSQSAALQEALAIAKRQDEAKGKKPNTSGIERKPVSSTTLKSVGYDGTHRVLEIEFHNGSVYQYLDVPKSVYVELMQADSLGRYFNRKIKYAGYTHRKTRAGPSQARIRTPEEPLKTAPTRLDLTSLAKRTRPAVMLLMLYGRTGKKIGTGTGFLVSADGKMLTNYHVIEKAHKAWAKAENGAMFIVEGVLAKDAKNDLAVLKLKAKKMPFLTLAEGTKVEAGTRVVVIGSPLGLEGTLSEGIVSAVRNTLIPGQQLLQISAAISPGSSGSPVLNARGIVIGIARGSLRQGQSLNFAVPAKHARALLASVQGTANPRRLGARALRSERIVVDPDLRAAINASAAGDVAELLKRAEMLVRRYPKSSLAHFVLGKAFADLKSWNNAIASYKQAIRLKADFAEAWLALGGTYSRMGRNTDAAAAYRKAVRLKPDYVMAWRHLGTAYNKMNKGAEAIAAYREAVRLKPDHAIAWNHLGSIYYKMNKNAEAVAAWRQAVKSNANDSASWCWLGMAYGKMGRRSDSIAALKESVKAKPDYVNAWRLLCATYLADGQHGKAREALERLRALDPAQAKTLEAIMRKRPQP
jgi:S1-C subfamily serine protease/cytochrome c-type biogenesis protein CcmH/NrfG